MQQRDLLKSIVIMTGVYAKTLDFDIIVNEQGIAKATETAVYIPKPKEELINVTWGYCFHEVGHKRFTDIPLFLKYSATSPLHNWMLNVIEDTMEERLMVEEFPGAKRNLNALATSVLTAKSSRVENATKFDLIKSYIFHYVRFYLTKYDAWNEYSDELEAAVIQEFGFLVIDGLRSILDGTLNARSTVESIAISDAVFTYLRDLLKQDDSDKPESPNSPDSTEESDNDQTDQDDDSQNDNQPGSEFDNSDSEDSSGGNSGDSNQDGSDDENQDESQIGASGSDADENENGEEGSATGESQSTEADSDNGPSDDGCDSDSNSNQSKADQASNSASQSMSNSAGGELTDEVKQAVADFLKATEDELGESDTGRMAEALLNDSDNQEPLTPAERNYAGEAHDYDLRVSQSKADQMKSTAFKTTSHLRQSLLRLLEEQTRTQRITTRRGRRLSGNKVHRLATGNTRIFKRKFEEREGIDCDVVVLSDTSGSMGYNIESVKVATYALLQSLSLIEGCNTACMEFGETLGIIQKPSEGFSAQVQGRITAMSSSGGTPAAESYWTAIHALTQMSGHKKVVIMVTDGEPNDAEATKELVETLRANGVIVVCLGVGVDPRTVATLNYVYGANQWQRVSSFQDLPKQLLVAAQRVI